MDGIHHIALRVSDPAVSARFYAQVAGLRELRSINGDNGEIRAIWLQAGLSVLMLERSLRGDGSGGGSGHVLVFPTKDIEAALQTLLALGIPVSDRTANTVYFMDQDGHRVGLSDYRFKETTP